MTNVHDPHTPPACRYDRDTDSYLLPSHRGICTSSSCPGCVPCTHTDDGIPVRHCTARTHCASHLSWRQARTCTNCITRTRRDLNTIRHAAEQLSLEAVHAGIDSEAAMLAGPSFQTSEQFEADHHRTMSLFAGRITGDVEPHSLHPVSVLGYWTTELRDAYQQPSGLRITVPRAVDYLHSVLNRVAQDPDQEWTDIARDIRRCRSHLEHVLHDSRHPETGAACPTCTTPEHPGPALEHRHSHWCLDPECTELHDATGAADRWVCPRNPTHQWTNQAYVVEVATQFLQLSPWLTAAQISEKHRIPLGTVYHLAKTHRVPTKRFGGRNVYRVNQLLAARTQEKNA